jgi:putative transposase
MAMMVARMPRPPRLHVPGGFYHVILRGNHREALFACETDRDRLNEIVADVIERQHARVHAFCWMTNHLHALVQVGERPLGGVMQRIAQQYARYRHRQLRTSGHLFERRYRAWLVDADSYFVTLLRYIHLNPVKARMVTHADEYPWSSHRCYTGQATIAWLTLDFGMSLFGSTEESARQQYRHFMAHDSYASEDRIFEQTHPEDPRVLGTDRFMASLVLPPFKPRSAISLSALVDAVCREHAVSPEIVRSVSRQRKLTAVRVEIAMRALDRRVATLVEVAAFLNREPASLSELLSRHRR